MAFRWKNFEDAVQFVFNEVNQSDVRGYHNGSFVKYAMSMYSNNEEEGLVEAWLDLRKAVLGKFDEKINELESKKLNYIKVMKGLGYTFDELMYELEEYDENISSVEHYKERSKKMLQPDWLRKVLRK